LNRFFKRGKDSELERELRRNRPQPRDEFVQMLSKRVERESRLGRSLRSRIAGVAVASAVMLAAVGAFGGIGYAANGVKDVVKVAKSVVVAAKGDAKKSGGDNKGDNKSGNGDNKGGNDNKGKGDDGGKPDDKQYGHKKKICHEPGPHQRTIEVGDDAVPAHLAHGDYLGECKK
jgi:hypothetical protein